MMLGHAARRRCYCSADSEAIVIGSVVLRQRSYGHRRTRQKIGIARSMLQNRSGAAEGAVIHRVVT